MSIKYDVRTIRKEEIAEHLKPFYPDTLEGFDALRKSKAPFTDSSSDQDFRLLALARKCEAHILLPTVFFSCAKHPLPEILAASPIVAQDDLNAIIVGREILMKDANRASHITNLSLLRSRGGECLDESCIAKRRDSVDACLTFYSYRPPPFPLLLPPEGDFYPPDNPSRMCKECLKLTRKEAKNIRERAWENLPDAFGLGDWEELQQKMGST